MFCQNCGSKLLDQSIFCSKCGARLRADNTGVTPKIPFVLKAGAAYTLGKMAMKPFDSLFSGIAKHPNQKSKKD